MFNQVQYKKEALNQLKKQGTISIILGGIALAIFLFLFASAKNSTNLIISGSFFAIIFGVIGTSCSYFFLKLSRTNEQMKFDDFLFGLSEFWQKGVLGGLYFFVWVLFWSFFFIVPGIVKAISYSQMFFIIAENPKISIRKAMNISKVMMNNHKSDYFFMVLSFLGWFILATIPFCVGHIFLIPYMKTTFANAYSNLKLEAINTKILTPADFLTGENK